MVGISYVASDVVKLQQSVVAGERVMVLCELGEESHRLTCGNTSSHNNEISLPPTPIFFFKRDLILHGSAN